MFKKNKIINIINNNLRVNLDGTNIYDYSFGVLSNEKQR